MKKLLLSTLLLANGVAVVAAPFVVKDIRVEGVSAETEASVIPTLPVKVGQRATDADISNLVRQLFVQDRFDNISARREGSTLVVQVAERPVLSEVKVEGNKAIPTEALEQNLKANLISKGEVYNADKVKAFADSLLEHYHSTGRYNATVEPVLTPTPEGGNQLTIKIDENDVTYVKNIQFEGLSAFKEKKLLSQLNIQPDVPWWDLFNSSKYEGQAQQQDFDILRSYYMDRGYAKYRLANYDAKFSDDKKEVDLTYTIHEGDQYRVSEIRIVGDTANLTNELTALTKNYEIGDLFRANELQKLEEAIKDKLGQYGYGSAKVDLYPSFDEENKTVRVNFIVDAGKRLYVRKIRFEGNDVTADSTLRREMRQQEGAWLSTTATALGKARLERTGFYETVDMQTLPVQNSVDQVDVVYKIKERNTGSINFGIGYGTESGFSYQAGIKQDNFLGMGSTISLSGTRNDYGTSVNLGYTEPYFTKDGVSLGGNIFYEDYDNSKNNSSASYKRKTYGIDGTLGFPVDEYNSYYLGLGVVRDKLSNVTREFNREIYVNSMDFDYDRAGDVYRRIKTTDFNFSFGWNYNSLNRGFLPTQGLQASLGGRVTIPGSDNKYYKLSAGFSHYYPLNREHKWVVNTRVNLAYANGFGGKGLPFFQTYSAGGIGSVRGFSYGAIGPRAIYLDQNKQFNSHSYDVVGGNAMGTASLELIMPTPFVSEKYQHNVRTSAFFDIGSVWNTKWNKDLYPALPDFGDYKKFRSSAGIAFQWNSPIGPLVFSYAKPIRKYDGDDIEQFQFSIGSSF
ncbi:outer membrane protein assembly factor BamA [Pasteurellaceae bacterium RH1A]|nr:outer membrane protein assembly factor BamA [Pasteurellaceae bacterium RH1A]